MKKNSIYSITVWVAMGTLVVASALLHASETDSRIESTAQNSHIFKKYLSEDSITTTSKDGVVTLTGTVSEASHKSLAQDTVESLPGVVSVNNQLVVKEGSPVEKSDPWLELKVKTALLFHRKTNAFKTEVTSKDGDVTLTGEASSAAQKELATEYASDVDGVKTVKNSMTVASASANASPAPDQTMGEKLDDASITAQIKWSLLAHRSTNALTTKVQTTDGVVTVSGIAKTAAEKTLVTKLVNDINGVGSVINHMTIEVASAAN